jgi:hypothetical protein
MVKPNFLSCLVAQRGAATGGALNKYLATLVRARPAWTALYRNRICGPLSFTGAPDMLRTSLPRWDSATKGKLKKNLPFLAFQMSVVGLVSRSVAGSNGCAQLYRR